MSPRLPSIRETRQIHLLNHSLLISQHRCPGRLVTSKTMRTLLMDGCCMQRISLTYLLRRDKKEQQQVLDSHILDITLLIFISEGGTRFLMVQS